LDNKVLDTVELFPQVLPTRTERVISHCNAVPKTHVLDHSSYRTILTAHTRHCRPCQTHTSRGNDLDK